MCKTSIAKDCRHSKTTLIYFIFDCELINTNVVAANMFCEGKTTEHKNGGTDRKRKLEGDNKCRKLIYV